MAGIIPDKKRLLLGLAAALALPACGGSADVQCPSGRWRSVKLVSQEMTCDDVLQRTEEARSFLLAAGRGTARELDEGMRNLDLTVRPEAAWDGPDGLVDGFTKEGSMEVDWSGGSMAHELEHVLDMARGRNAFFWDDPHGGWGEDGSWALGELFAEEVYEETGLAKFASRTPDPCDVFRFTAAQRSGLEAAGHDVISFVELGRYNGCPNP